MNGEKTTATIIGLLFTLLVGMALVSSSSVSPAQTGIGTVLALCSGIALYFVPSFVGGKKKNANAIMALNFFLGWTLVGWVVALVWALTKEDKPQNDSEGKGAVQQPILCAHCGKYSMPYSAFCSSCGRSFGPPVASGAPSQ